MPSTPRLGLQYPAGSDNVSGGPAVIQANATTLDSKAAVFLQGTAAARPAAGTQGRFYYETDTGLLKYDDGSNWDIPSPADAGVTSRKAKLTAGVVRASSTLTLTGTPADIPSATLALTPNVPSLLLAWAIFAVQLHAPDGSSTGDMAGYLNVDGTDQTPYAEANIAPSANTYENGVATESWAIPLTAVAHTIKLRAKSLSFGSGSAIVQSATLTYLLLAS